MHQLFCAGHFRSFDHLSCIGVPDALTTSVVWEERWTNVSMLFLEVRCLNDLWISPRILLALLTALSTRVLKLRLLNKTPRTFSTSVDSSSCVIQRLILSQCFCIWYIASSVLCPQCIVLKLDPLKFICQSVDQSLREFKSIVAFQKSILFLAELTI